MTKEGKIVLSFFFVLYAVQYIFKFLSYSMPTWIQFYLADILALPVILIISLLVLRKLTKHRHYILSNAKIFFTFLYVAIFFEGIMPYFKARYTYDPIDIVAYALGAFAYAYFQKRWFVH